ncbi:MAG: TRAP transporter small permease [Burkholderiaceae bacterium]|nr:TRAP transporter small permease [Burkholderiaceae bacterium]
MKALLLRLDRLLSGLALNLACLILAVITGLGLWQVISRFVLSQPSTFTEEAMRRLLIWMVMLGVVVAFRRGALVSVDLMLRLSQGLWQTTVRWIITASSLAFLAVLVWFGIQLAWRVRFQTFASMELSMAWAYAAFPVGAALALVAVLAHHLDFQSTELESAQ